MKTKVYLYILATIALVVACEDMNSVHEDFIKNGEIIYAIKPDTTVAFPGRNRVLFKAGFVTAPYITQLKIDWENGLESKVFDIEGKNDSVMYDLWIEGLKEKAYEFKLYALDHEGNRSVKINKFVSAYGDKYEVTLQNRLINSIRSYPPSAIIINWESAARDMLFAELIYKNQDGNTKTIRVKPEVNMTTLTDCDLTKDLVYKSVFLPVKNALDTFYTEPAKIEF